jgi:hypothetical protein
MCGAVGRCLGDGCDGGGEVIEAIAAVGGRKAACGDLRMILLDSLPIDCTLLMVDVNLR